MMELLGALLQSMNGDVKHTGGGRGLVSLLTCPGVGVAGCVVSVLGTFDFKLGVFIAWCNGVTCIM